SVPLSTINTSFVAQGFDWVEVRGARRRVNPRHEADQNCKGGSAQYKPPRYGPDVRRGQVLAFQVEGSSEVNRSANAPAQEHSERATHQAHHARLGEEELPHIPIGGA